MRVGCSRDFGVTSDTLATLTAPRLWCVCVCCLCVVYMATADMLASLIVALPLWYILGLVLYVVWSGLVYVI